MWLFNIVGKAPLFTNMSLIYSDSFHDDEDLCNILAALQLGSCITSVAIPQAAVRDTSTRVTQAASTRQHAPNETPADRSSLVLYDHLRTPVADPVGKYPHICSLFCILLIIFVVSVLTQPDSIPGGIYNVLSGKRTGVRNTWCILGASHQVLVTNCCNFLQGRCQRCISRC
jgi:hypothetical protein